MQSYFVIYAIKQFMFVETEISSLEPDSEAEKNLIAAK